MKNISSTLKSSPVNLKGEMAERKIKELQLELEKLQQAAWQTSQRTVIVLEGFDAAGKGTCIRRLTARLDPRSCTVIPIGAPSLEELGQHYLQRFWKHLPTSGRMVIFDRSWYGRVLVEKVEKLAPPDRLQAAYKEINAFEKMLKDDGFVVIKIFLVVSKDEQLKRFKARLADPLKNWKITADDVRNRRRWNDYVKAADVMVAKCPGWQVIASDDKDYARLAVLRIVVKALQEQVRVPKTEKTRLDQLARQLLRS